MKITWPRDVFSAPLIGVLGALLFGATETAGAQDVLPRPEEPFGGKIGRTVKESIKDFHARGFPEFVRQEQARQSISKEDNE